MPDLALCPFCGSPAAADHERVADRILAAMEKTAVEAFVAGGEWGTMAPIRKKLRREARVAARRWWKGDDEMRWQKCPICDGSGLVSRPAHVAADQPSFGSSNAGPWACPTCNGLRIILEAQEEAHGVRGYERVLTPPEQRPGSKEEAHAD